MQLKALDSEAGLRLDVWLAGRMAITRSRAQTLIRSGAVVGQSMEIKPGTIVRSGLMVTVNQLSENPTAVIPENIPLDILFEDDSIIAVNKQAGIVVHPAAGHWTGTLANALLHHCRALGAVGDAGRPGIVHRLDRDTSGVMIAAKTSQAMESITNQFKSGDIIKHYLAIVRGAPPKHFGKIETLIGRDERNRKRMSATPKSGKAALTEYTIIAKSSEYSLLLVRIYTGRTHQIRVHLAHIGCPVAGDSLYGGRRQGLSKNIEIGKSSRQLLHSWRLKITHPLNNEKIIFQAPIPSDMRTFAECAGIAFNNLPD